jgi:serine/threonine-protein kinase
MEQTNFARGELFGDRYIIQGKIGRGGMGSVFLALDKKTGRQVALKTLHKRYADNRSAIARFIREIATVRRLNHPGIVKILDAQKLDDMFFYTMEYVEGKSLRSLLTTSTKARVSIRCAHSLPGGGCVEPCPYHYHSSGPSPENIMVVRDGTIRLLDFGLAKLEDGFKDLTVTGVDLGKVQYMAPEQQVNAGKVDCRARSVSPGGDVF